MDEKTELLTKKDYDDEAARLNDLTFPWPVARLHIDPEDFHVSKRTVGQRLWLSHHFQLLVVFIISIVCIAFGISYIADSYDRFMLYVFFIVQGASGLFVVFTYVCAMTSLFPALLMKELSLTKRQAERYLIVIAQLMIVGCIIWFAVGHKWFLAEFLNERLRYDHNQTPYVFFIVILIIQYVVGVWLFCSCVHNNLRLIQRNKTNTQRLMSVETQQSTAFEKMPLNISSTDQDLILFDYDHDGCPAKHVPQKT